MLRLPTENTLDREENIMAEWINTTLEECTDILGDGLHGTPKYTENGEYAFVNGNNLVDGEILIKKETKRVDYSQYDKYKKPLTNRTILVSINGTLGNVGVYGSEKIILGKSACYFNVKESVDKDFIYYIVSSPTFKHYLESNATGTTIKNISLKQMRKYTFELPEIGEQKRISSVLRKIDEKIKNNRAINKNLEQQAQALFKSWFVEFEPFNGTMPSDWEIVPLEKIADFQNGYAFKSKELLNEPSPDCYQVFKQGHIARGGGFIPDGTKSWYPKSIASKLEKFVLKKGDILMAMTDMKDNVAILGNTAVMPLDNEYIVNQRVGHLRANGYKGVTYPFIYLLTNSTDFLVDLRSRANSGVQVNLSSSEIKASQTVLPSEEVNNAFSEITLPMFEIIINNQLENQRLAQLRDTLLPKLMAGELDVSNIEI